MFFYTLFILVVTKIITLTYLLILLLSDHLTSPDLNTFDTSIALIDLDIKSNDKG